MKKKILTTVALIAFTGTIPALAETIKTKAEAGEGVVQADNITKDDNGDIKVTKSDMSEAYDEIKVTLIGQGSAGKNMSVVIDSRITAKGIINQHLYTEPQESVAKITDMILDKDGDSIMIIVSESLLGLGTKSSFDYRDIISTEEEGSALTPLSEKIIAKATPFSYTKEDSNDKINVIPDGGYSLAKLLEGKLVNHKKKYVADIENISFKNGKAHHIIIKSDEVIDNKIAIYYADTEIVKDDEVLTFQMSADQFEKYKNLRDH